MAKKVQRGWFTEVVGGDVKLAVVEKTSRTIDGITDNWQAITETGLSLVIEAIGSNADLTSLSGTSTFDDIPSRYHKVIVDKVIASGYKDPRNMELNNAQFFDQEFEKGLKRAKKMSKSAYYAGPGRIVPQDF